MLLYWAKKGINMENITSLVSVQVDTHDKEMANDILKNLGLNMSTYVNMAIKQLLYTNGLPFEVKKPNEDTLRALRAAQDIIDNFELLEEEVDNFKDLQLKVGQGYKLYE